MRSFVHVSAWIISITLAAAAGAAEPAAPTGEALSLSQAEQYALHRQPSIRQAQGQAEAAAGRVEEARAGYLPQLAANATYERTTGNYAARPGSLPTTVTANGMTVTTTSSVSWDPAYNYWNFGVTGQQLIYDFNATADRWRSASASRDSAVSTARATETTALFGVRRAYFQARAQRDLARVAEEAVANQQKHVDQIDALVKAGMRSQIDLVTTKTALANARVQMVTAENNYAASLALLNQAMGAPTERPYELTDDQIPAVAGEDGDQRTLTDQALKARPEIAAADQARVAQERLVAAYRGTYGPSLSAIGGLSDVGSALDRLAPNWYVGLSASWAFFQGGLTTGQVREANGTLTALTAAADAARLQVEVDVEQARLAVRAAKSTIDGAEESLTNAREQLRLAEGRYKTGQGSVIELSDAQVAYTTAEAQEVSARFGLAASRAQLLAALGVRS
ncbi:MAG TPA: TolC family protein [Polyangia bacterium]|nr:TolC family protein [Polyangia bacterium]